MNGFLDIYVKIIIAVFTFIAPLILYLLGLFSEGVALIKKRSKEEEMQIKNLLRIQVTSDFDSQIVDRSNKQLKVTKNINTNRLNLLNPKRQIIRIYATLMVTLSFIMADLIVRDPYFGIYNHSLSVILIVASLFCFIIAIVILKQIAWAIIDTKELIDNGKIAIPVDKEIRE